MRTWLALATWFAAVMTGTLAVVTAAGCGADPAVKAPVTARGPVDGSADQSFDQSSPSEGGGDAPPSPGVDSGAGVPAADAAAPDVQGPGATNPDTRGEASSGPCAPPVIPACDAPPPDPGARRAFRNGGPSAFGGGARHRGRDLFLPPSGPQWLIGRFAYGLLDTPITDEDVDIHLLRGCGATWEKLGTARTTGGQHAAVEGVDDNSGRVYFEIPADKRLGLGRHRVRFVVVGDLTIAEAFLEVVVPGTPYFVSDVDGTLTTDETAEVGALLSGTLPAANPGAADALKALVSRGYRPLYLTARSEALVVRTREFLSERGFPPGIIHTTSSGPGAMGAAAATYKTAALATQAGKGLKPSYVFGNSDTDAQAYENAAVRPLDHRIFFQFTDAQFKGRRIEAFAALLPEFAQLPLACP